MEGNACNCVHRLSSSLRPTAFPGMSINFEYINRMRFLSRYYPVHFQAKLEDVQRFKLASQVVQFIITSFGHTALFPRECYEFYARITGRTLRIDENYQFTFQYPSSESRFGERLPPPVECFWPPRPLLLNLRLLFSFSNHTNLFLFSSLDFPFLHISHGTFSLILIQQPSR